MGVYGVVRMGMETLDNGMGWSKEVEEEEESQPDWRDGEEEVVGHRIRRMDEGRLTTEADQRR